MAKTGLNLWIKVAVSQSRTRNQTKKCSSNY